MPRNGGAGSDLGSEWIVDYRKLTSGLTAGPLACRFPQRFWVMFVHAVLVRVWATNPSRLNCFASNSGETHFNEIWVRPPR
jgi:hypothetical protein